MSGITPSSGLNSGGVGITNLAGTNFVSGATVKITKSGQSDIAATGVSFVNSTQLTCTLPVTGAAAGLWNVVVTNPDAQSVTLSNSFTVVPVPVVTSISPTAMPANGASQTLVFTGSNFQSGNITQFNWGVGAGSGVWNTGVAPTINNSGQITTTINPGTVTDTIYARVCLSASATTPSDCSSGAQAVTVTQPPTVTAITPGVGLNNASIGITNLAGTGFISGATVKLTKSGQSDITATGVAFVNSAKLTCTLPISGAATGAWNVVVTNPDTQTGTLTNGFAVTAAPLTPATPAGPVSTITWRSATYLTATTDPEGDQVKYGWDWGDGSAIEWSGLMASGASDSRSHTWTVAGTYNVRVKAQDSNGAESGWSTGLAVTVAIAPPTITAITPAIGYNYTGLDVTNLAGTGFLTGATVKLTKAGQADINATNVVVVSGNQLTCTFPITSAATGTWAVVVTNTDTKTGTLANGLTVAADVTSPAGVPATPSAGSLYNTSGDVTFTWALGGASDPESGISGYDLQVGIDAVNDASVFDGDAGNVFSKAFTGLAEGTYYARVRAKNGYNSPGAYTPWSAAFKVDLTPPVPDPPVGGNHQVYITSITWAATAPTDSLSGLHSQPYSFNNGAEWQAGASSTTAGLQPDTLYSKTLKYRDAAGNLTSGLAVSTYTLAMVPSATSFSNPATTGFRVGWGQNGNPGGTTYAAEISKFSNFQPVAASSITANTQADFTGLEVSVRYYARAQAINRNNIPTAYTAAASTYTLANPPTGTQVTGVSSGTVTLTWSGNGNSTSTVYRIARSLDDSSYDVLAATYSSPAAIAALGPETANYFKVLAENGAGAATAYDSAVSTFVPDYTPPTGMPATPADEGIFRSSTAITFNWTIGTSADPESGIAGYYLEVGTNAATNNKSAFNGGVGGVLTKQLTGLTDGKTYFARVKPENGRGFYGNYSAWSDGITVDTTPPTAPVITSLSHPDSSVIYFSSAAQFAISSVDSVSGVDGYHFEINNTSDTALPTPDSEYLAGQSVSTTAALAAGTWYLHALPRDIAGNTGLAGQLSHYTIRIGSAVDPARDNVFDSGEAANKVVVSIASGAVSAAASMVIETKQKTTVPPAPTDSTTKDAGVYKEIGLSTGAVLPGKTVTISIAYEAWQVAGLDEDSLRLAYYNPARGRWEIVYDTVIDKTSRTLTVTVDHFSLWKIVAYTAQASPLANVSNYPNPFTAGRGGQTKIHYSLKADSAVEIKIYDLLGKLAWRKDIPPGAAGGSIGVNDVAWDGRNDRGSYVGAGAYICIVKAGGESGKVKIAVK